MSLKPVRDRIAILRYLILKLEKTEDRVLDPVMRANLVRLLLDYSAELDAGVSVEPPCQQQPSNQIHVCGADGMAARLTSNGQH